MCPDTTSSILYPSYKHNLLYLYTSTASSSTTAQEPSRSRAPEQIRPRAQPIPKQKAIPIISGIALNVIVL